MPEQHQQNTKATTIQYQRYKEAMSKFELQGTIQNFCLKNLGSPNLFFSRVAPSQTWPKIILLRYKIKRRRKIAIPVKIVLQSFPFTTYFFIKKLHLVYKFGDFLLETEHFMNLFGSQFCLLISSQKLTSKALQKF